MKEIDLDNERYNILDEHVVNSKAFKGNKYYEVHKIMIVESYGLINICLEILQTRTYSNGSFNKYFLIHAVGYKKMYDKDRNRIEYMDYLFDQYEYLPKVKKCMIELYGKYDERLANMLKAVI